MVRSMRFWALASTAMCCCAVASPALAVSDEPSDGHVSDSTCSISDGMGSVGGGSGGIEEQVLISGIKDNTEIGDGGSGIIHDGGTRVIGDGGGACAGDGGSNG